MSDAFRSQLEAADEKVRRAEEELATLRDEKAKLERRLSPLQKPLNLWAGGFGIAALTTAFVALSTGVYNKRVRASLEAEAAAASAREAEATRQRDERLTQCVAETVKCEQKLRSCRSPDAPPPLPPTRKPCNCAPGDPLCSCLDDAPFDKGSSRPSPAQR